MLDDLLRRPYLGGGARKTGASQEGAPRPLEPSRRHLGLRSANHVIGLADDRVHHVLEVLV
eukprot:3198793-Pyramimonas_sp.AAC.1